MVVSGTPASRASSATPSAMLFGHAFELRIDLALVLDQVSDGGDSGGHCQRIAAERSGLVDRAQRREHVHHVGASAEGSAGQAAAEDLAQRSQVGSDAVELLRAAQREPEAGHHLVEDQQRAVLGRDAAAALRRIAWRGRNRPRVADHRLDDDAGDLRRMGGEGCLHRGEIVVGQRERVLRGLRRNACRAGNAEASPRPSRP